MSKYGKVTLGLLVVWFVTVFSLAAGHWLQNPANGFGAGIAIAALTPLVVFAVWAGASKGFREFLLSLDARVLTATQTGRLVGFVFVLLEARTLLPSVFALPAGYGDMAIGATATLVAWQLAKPEHRAAFILWQVLGIVDLVTAVATGTTAQLVQPEGPTMRLMTVLPLSLIPTFFVPLFTMFHVISIAQARKWSATAAESRRRVLRAAGNVAV
jgi:xanthosine utilization system XapX-like protein